MTPKQTWAERQRKWQRAQEEAIAKAMMSPPVLSSLLKVVPFPGVVIIMGARGEGKSGLAYAIAEQMHKRRKLPAVVYVPINLAQLVSKVGKLTPKWVTVLTRLENLPKKCIVIVDEASQAAHARRTQSNQSLALDRLVGIARQKQQLLIFITHHSRKLDPNLIHDADLILWKKPTYAHSLFERSEISTFTFKALEFFSGIKGKLTVKKTCLGMDFHHLRFYTFKNQLPLWWSEELSHVFEDV